MAAGAAGAKGRQHLGGHRRPPAGEGSAWQPRGARAMRAREQPRGGAGSGGASQRLRTAAESGSPARRAERRPVPPGESSLISPPGRSCGLDGTEVQRAA